MSVKSAHRPGNPADRRYLLAVLCKSFGISVVLAWHPPFMFPVYTDYTSAIRENQGRSCEQQENLFLKASETVKDLRSLASNAFLIRKAQNKKIPPEGGTFCFCLLGHIPNPH